MGRSLWEPYITHNANVRSQTWQDMLDFSLGKIPSPSHHTNDWLIQTTKFKYSDLSLVTSTTLGGQYLEIFSTNKAGPVWSLILFLLNRCAGRITCYLERSVRAKVCTFLASITFFSAPQWPYSEMVCGSRTRGEIFRSTVPSKPCLRLRLAKPSNHNIRLHNGETNCLKIVRCKIRLILLFPYS